MAKAAKKRTTVAEFNPLYPTVRLAALNYYGQSPFDEAKPKDRILAALKRRLRDEGDPTDTGGWDRFYVAIRDDCDAWLDRKKGKHKRGFGERNIKLLTEPLRPR
jgi:hypothetical protein